MNKKEVVLYYNLIEVIVDKFLSKNPRFRYLRDDLVQEGSLGLMRSISTYDKSKGASKVTYYSRGIRNYVTNYVQKVCRRVGVVTYIDTVHSKYIEEEDDVETSDEIYKRYLPKHPIDRAIYEEILAGTSTIGELQKSLGVSRKALEHRKARLIKRLKVEMEDEI